ncbi:MAG: redoxin family protein [Citrobacter telavivensis]
MNFFISEHNITLGKDFELTFGDVRLSLDNGFMHPGGALPTSSGLVAPDLSQGKIDTGIRKIIYTVPSLDTPVCEHQIKSVSALLDKGELTDYDIYVISVDTPFAQSRFIKENCINDKIKFLSDYADHCFMTSTGLRIKELNIFARSVIKCDENNIVEEALIPKDITKLP